MRYGVCVRMFLGLPVLVLLLAAPATPSAPAVCRGEPGLPVGAAAFHSMLDSIAVSWNEGRPDLAVACFDEDATYVEPPDRQLFRGRRALRDFFAASIQPARPDRMRWHTMAFDSLGQVGFAEYTYRGRQYYHGVAVIELRRGLIARWREYQYWSPLPRDRFLAPSR